VQGYNPRWDVSAAAVWCNSSLHAPGTRARNCTEMRVLTCVKKPPLEKRQIAGAVAELQLTGSCDYQQAVIKG
jgi:hypothetical protein